MGVIYSIEAVLPAMLARRRGQLMAVSSLAGDKGLPGESAYCASKAAVNVYMEGLRIAVRGSGVVVTTVCPGFVRTPDGPDGRRGHAVHDVRRGRRRPDRPARSSGDGAASTGSRDEWRS